jgi:hypothetical protein
MKLHANAKTCPKSRRLLVQRVEAGWSASLDADRVRASRLRRANEGSEALRTGDAGPVRPTNTADRYSRPTASKSPVSTSRSISFSICDSLSAGISPVSTWRRSSRSRKRLNLRISSTITR